MSGRLSTVFLQAMGRTDSSGTRTSPRRPHVGRATDQRYPRACNRHGVIRTASDGLPARLSGPWTQEKLRDVQKYAAAFTRAMTPKRQGGLWSELVYLDLPCQVLDGESTALPVRSSRAPLCARWG